MGEPLMDKCLDRAEACWEKALLRVSAGDCAMRSCWHSVHLLRLRPHEGGTTSARIVFSRSGRTNGSFDESRGSATSTRMYPTASARCRGTNSCGCASSSWLSMRPISLSAQVPSGRSMTGSLSTCVSNSVSSLGIWGQSVATHLLNRALVHTRTLRFPTPSVC